MTHRRCKGEAFPSVNISERLNRLPNSLYKYTGLSGNRSDWMRHLLLDSKVYFPSSSEFNDPLDCRIPPSFDASPLKIEQFWRNYVRRECPSDKLSSYKSRIKKLVRKSVTQAGKEQLAQMAIRDLDKHGILCLSEDPTSMLMWSYYAEGHKGIAVRFNLDRKNLASISEVLITIEVEYSRDFPNIPYYQLSPDDLADRMFRFKSNEWKHEREWRLVRPDQTGYLQVPPEVIDGVVFGLRVDAAHEEAIRGWIEERSAATELLRVQNVPGSFKLETVPA